MFKRILLAAIAASVAACASVVLMATPEADSAAKAFEAAPDMASLYVYRDSQNKVDNVHVFLDDTPLGDLAHNTYHFKQLPPGHYTLHAKQILSGHPEVELDLKAGSLAFVEIAFPVTVSAALIKLRVVDSSEGRKGVMAAKLAITN